MTSFLSATSASLGQLLDHTAESPQTSLCILFVFYKSLIDIIAFSAPGNGFDTSHILAGWPQGGALSKLMHWDAIWFTNLAQRGYKFEQDFAFGYGYTNLLAFAGRFWSNASFDTSLQREAAFGVLISHVSHLLGALLLYRISLIVFRNHEKGERIAFIASCIHIVSPAGVFLCAPYTEAPFSLLKFLAYFSYASSHLDHNAGRFLQRDAQVLLAGALMGTACTFRSNGLLSGIIFAMDAIEDGLAFLRYRGDFARLRKIAATCAAGLMIGCGQAYPQFLAWREFCTDRNPFGRQPFCSNFPPAIYPYIQRKYWDVGLFRYWQARQIPSFLLAAPVLFAMLYSSYWVYTIYRNPPTTEIPAEDAQPLVGSPATLERSSGELSMSLPVPQIDMRLLLRFTIPQSFIAITCIFVSHVQIATRLSSAYPTWYWWIAVQILHSVSPDAPVVTGWKSWVPVFYSRFAIIYGIIQCGLFAEHLPPP